AELNALPPEGERIDLTFRGEPVEGSRSIVAEFGGRAVALFSDAVATIAASLAGQLGATGPLPGRAPPLRIVGPAVGSFGFELELPRRPEPSQSQLFAEPEELTALAVKRAMTLIEVAGRADDEELSDYIADVHPRAATKLHEFVKLVVDRRATFNVCLRGRKSGLEDAEDGHRVLAALYMKDVKEEELRLSGRLWVLPESRQFELKTTDGALFKGAIDRGLSE